jgi:hypothetical protein
VREALAGAWDRFWFAPGSARDLAAARVAVAATALWVVLSRDLPAISGVPAAFWAGVPARTRWRFLLFPGHEALERALLAVLVVALIGVLVGACARPLALVAGLLAFHLAPLESIVYSSEPFLRGLTLPVLALLPLALSPCDSAWSVAAIRGRPAARPAWEYHWPVRLIQVWLATLYFFSGYAKLYATGWRWASPDNLRNWLLAYGQSHDVAPPLALGLWVADQPALCLAIGVATLAAELAFPLVLISRRARLALVPAALSMHLGSALLMSITVLYLPLFVVFVDWSRAAQGAGRRAAAGEGHAIVAAGGPGI